MAVMSTANARIEGNELVIGNHSANLPALKKAVTTLVDLAQEIPGEMMKWDSKTLEEMSLPDLKDLWEIRALLRMIDEAMEGNKNVES